VDHLDAVMDEAQHVQQQGQGGHNLNNNQMNKANCNQQPQEQADADR